VPGDGGAQRRTDAVAAAGVRLEPGRVRLAVQPDRADPGLLLLPDPADGAGFPARARRPADAVAGSGGQPRRIAMAVPAVGRGAAADAGVSRVGVVVVRQRL